MFHVYCAEAFRGLLKAFNKLPPAIAQKSPRYQRLPAPARSPDSDSDNILGTGSDRDSDDERSQDSTTRQLFGTDQLDAVDEDDEKPDGNDSDLDSKGNVRDLIAQDEDDEDEDEATDEDLPGKDEVHDLTGESPSLKSRLSTPKSTTPKSTASTRSKESQSSRAKKIKVAANAQTKSKKAQRKRPGSPDSAATKATQPKAKKRKTMELRQTDMTSSKRCDVCFVFCASDLTVAFECIMKVLSAFSLHT